MGASQVVLVVRNTHASAEDVRDRGLMAESGRSPREGNGYLLQYSCLENPVDRGAWQVTVHGVRSSLVSSFCCTARSSVTSSSFRSSSSLYTKAQLLVEDVHKGQCMPSTRTNLCDWMCKCTFTFLEVHNLKVGTKGFYCTGFGLTYISLILPCISHISVTFRCFRGW